MRRSIVSTLCLAAITALGGGAPAAAGNWANRVISHYNLDVSPYNDPLQVLGLPTANMLEPIPGKPGEFTNMAVSLVYQAYTPWMSNVKCIATMRDNGYIVVEFDPVIEDDPLNWENMDFIVFGNGIFGGSEGITETTNMETLLINGDGEGAWDPMTVSVSQDGQNWIEYTTGPYADSYMPTNAYAWDWVENTWGPMLDFTKPVTLLPEDVAGKSAAETIDIFNGSGGGTAYNIHNLNLAENPQTGRKWIKYIKVKADIQFEQGLFFWGEVDAFARVGHTVQPISIGEAKTRGIGERVILKEAVVTAGTYETGRFCWIQHPDGSGGIKVYGRVLSQGDKITLSGVVDEINGEKAIKATAVSPSQGIEPLPQGEVRPLGMPNKSVSWDGLTCEGRLVRTWGKVVSADTVAKSFIISDGSPNQVKCIAPRLVPSEIEMPNPGNPNWGVSINPNFVLPDQDDNIIVTGIASKEPETGLLVIRLRTANDYREVQQ